MVTKSTNRPMGVATLLKRCFARFKFWMEADENSEPSISLAIAWNCMWKSLCWIVCTMDEQPQINASRRVLK